MFLNFFPGQCYLAEGNIVVLILGRDDSVPQIVFCAMLWQRNSQYYTINFAPIDIDVLQNSIIEIQPDGKIHHESFFEALSLWGNYDRDGVKYYFTVPPKQIVEYAHDGLKIAGEESFKQGDMIALPMLFPSVGPNANSNTDSQN